MTFILNSLSTGLLPRNENFLSSSGLSLGKLPLTFDLCDKPGLSQAGGRHSRQREQCPPGQRGECCSGVGGTASCWTWLQHEVRRCSKESRRSQWWMWMRTRWERTPPPACLLCPMHWLFQSSRGADKIGIGISPLSLWEKVGFRGSKQQPQVTQLVSGRVHPQHCVVTPLLSHGSAQLQRAPRNRALCLAEKQLASRGSGLARGKSFLQGKWVC